MATRSVLAPVISGLAAILILAAGCSEQSPTAVQLDPVSASASLGVKANVLIAAQPYAAGSYSAIIGSEGGSLNFGIGSITFPAGAVSRPTRITAATNGRDVAVEFGPHGLQFPAGSSPTLTFSGLNEILPGKVQISYLDRSNNVLELLTTGVNVTSGTVVAELGHFSKYATIAD